MLQIQQWLDFEHRNPENSSLFTDKYDRGGTESQI